MKIFITIIFSLIIVNAEAQTNFIDIGIEGGLSIASLRGNDIIEKYHSSKFGQSFGVCFEYKFDRTFSLRSGASYELKGSSYKLEARDENGQPIGTINGSINCHNITIPLLIRTTIGDKIKYFMNSGPYISFLIKQTSHSDAIKNLPEINSDETGNYEKLELGLSLGLGLNYSINDKQALSFEVRDILGLTNIYKGGKIKTNALYFIVGYNYKLYK